MINVKDYGAIGNGVADDTAAIQSALNTGSSIYFPAGQYNISGALTISNNVSLSGDGMELSIIAATVATINMFNVTATGSVQFRDLNISSTAPKTGGIAISFSPAGATQNNRSVIERVRFMWQFQSVDFEKAAYWQMTGCHFEQNSAGGNIIRIRNTTTPDSGDAVLAFNQFYGGSGGNHILYEGGGGLRVIGNKFLMNAGGFVAIIAPGVQTGILVVSDNSFDGQTSTSLNITQADGTVLFTDINIHGNIFNGSPSNTHIYIEKFFGSNLGRCAIVGNVLLRNSGITPLLSIVSGGNYLVSGNTFNGAGGIVGVAIGSGVTNSAIGNNLYEGVVISNSSPTTIVNEFSIGGAAIVTPTLLNGWVNYGGNESVAGYWKDCSGTVHLQGTVKNGSNVIFTLPTGYRPSKNSKFTVSDSNSAVMLVVESLGNISIVGVGNTEVRLDGVSFRVA